MKRVILFSVVALLFASGCGPDNSVRLPDKPMTEEIPVVTENPGGGTPKGDSLKPRK